MERFRNLSLGRNVNRRDTAPLSTGLVNEMMYMTGEILTGLGDSAGVVHDHLEMMPAFGAHCGDSGWCSGAYPLLRLT